MLGSPLGNIPNKTKLGCPTELSFAGLKSLLQEIQNRGGQKGLNLTDICDNNMEKLGAPGSTLRKAVQNKVGDWKRNPVLEPSTQQCMTWWTCENLTAKSFQSERPLLFLGSTNQ